VLCYSHNGDMMFVIQVLKSNTNSVHHQGQPLSPQGQILGPHLEKSNNVFVKGHKMKVFPGSHKPTNIFQQYKRVTCVLLFRLFSSGNIVDILSYFTDLCR